MREEEKRLFEWCVMRHIDAAYNLARWLLRNDQDAEDVVQESAIRAYQSMPKLRSHEGKPWFLAIVRNSSMNRIRQRNSQKNLEEAMEDAALDAKVADPEELLLRAYESEALREAIDALPVNYREMIVLREFEGLSYREIGEVVQMPIGTVMSRLARARQALQVRLLEARLEERP